MPTASGVRAILLSSKLVSLGIPMLSLQERLPISNISSCGKSTPDLLNSLSADEPNIRVDLFKVILKSYNLFLIQCNQYNIQN
jgi:hypothetical protein